MILWFNLFNTQNDFAFERATSETEIGYNPTRILTKQSKLMGFIYFMEGKMKKLFVVWTLFLIFVLLPDIAFPQAQYLIDDENPFNLNLETIPPNNCKTVTITLDPGGVINTSLITAGCGISYDESQILITDVVVADADAGGPWDPGFTSAIPDPNGPGSYWVEVGNFNTVPVNAPIPICDVEFCCQGPGESKIDIFPGYAFTNIVGDTTVWDMDVHYGLINLTQIAPPCQCEITGSLTVEFSEYDSVTEYYTANLGPHCTNPPNYEWSDNCISGYVNQNGLLTVPPIFSTENCEICVMDLANTDINTGELVECCISIELVPGDSDEDGIPDNVDNCPNFYNPEQQDADEDGIGNACDWDGTAIPTLSEWGLILFMTIIMGLGVVILFRRRIE